MSVRGTVQLAFNAGGMEHFEVEILRLVRPCLAHNRPKSRVAGGETLGVRVRVCMCACVRVYVCACVCVCVCMCVCTCVW